MFTVAVHGPVQAQCAHSALYPVHIQHRCSWLSTPNSPISKRIEWHFSQFRCFFSRARAKIFYTNRFIWMASMLAQPFTIYRLPFRRTNQISAEINSIFHTLWTPSPRSPPCHQQIFPVWSVVCYTRNFGYPIIRCMCLLCMGLCIPVLCTSINIQRM